MSKNILDRKIPSLAGIGVIAFAAVVTTFLVRGPSTFQINANPGNEPKNIQITNVSDSSLTVSYVTDKNVVGTIIVGENRDDLDQLVLDDRDQLTQKINEYTTHSITVNNLDTNTEYFFTISSGGKKINNKGEPFNVKTGSRITSTPTNQIPIAGSVKDPEGNIIEDGLVLITINGAQKISSTLRENGNYTIPLNNLRISNLNNYFKIDDTTNIELEIFSNNFYSKVNVSGDQISPVPIITLSSNFDFLTQNNNSFKTIDRDEIKFPEFDSEISDPSPTKSPIE